MKLKSRLLMSFCIIIFVPLVLAGVLFFGVNRLQMKEFAKTYGLEGNTYYFLTSSIQMLSQMTESNIKEIEKRISQKPELLEQDEYLREINEDLADKYSFLLVRKDGALVYVGCESEELIPQRMPDYVQSSNDLFSMMYVDSKTESLVRKVDFESSEGAHISVFVVTRGAELIPEIKTLVLDFAFSIMLILLLTALLLVLWIYQGIITPIRKLQGATQNIKEGNLDFKIEVERADEIGELTRNFEEMRQRLKDNAEEKINSEKENRILISNISHDLKTPITAIKGYVEGIMDGVADTPEKVDKYIRTIYNKANELNLLINELTLYSNIDTNRIPYNFNKINVTDYFNDCVEELGMDLESKNIALSYFNFVEGDVLIIADPEQLKRVIYNIVGNSIKYRDKEKSRCFVNIRVKDVGDFIQVEIEDNGKGIAARDLPYVFDRFYRADSSRNSSTGGSGIGLSIVKKIIEDHGGKIWATSKESTGTIMYFVIRKYQEVTNE